MANGDQVGGFVAIRLRLPRLVFIALHVPRIAPPMTERYSSNHGHIGRQ